MNLDFNYRSPEAKKIMEMICRRGNVMKSVDVENRVFELFSVEADVDSGVKLAKEIKLDIPKGWYELSLKKSVEVGNLYTAAQSLEILDREFTQKETDLIIEMIILKGDMISFHYLENFSGQTFNLAVWQHIFLIRIVRKIWERKYEERSPQSNLLNFSKNFDNVFREFDITSVGSIYFPPVNKSFKLFDNATLAQFIFAQSKLGDDKFVKSLSREIMHFSPR